LIEKFGVEIQNNPELQARLPFARAWYAHRNQDGSWSFGPSKFIGYEGLDGDTYLRTAQETDGRRTEAQLQTMFKTIDPMDPLYLELSSALVAFLAKYGKAPSTKMRINVSRGMRRLVSQPATDDAYGAVVRMMVEVSKTLPTEHLKELREQLEDLWS
jgi:hypothetical protein